MKRSKMSSGQSKAMFRNTARYIHPANMRDRPMRGGWRM